MTDDLDDHHLEDDMNVDHYMELQKQPPPRYLCPYGCQKLIASRTIDYHKNNGCGRRNDSTATQAELKKRFYCCGACCAEFVVRSDFHAHLRIEHDVHPEINNIEFPDRQTFDRFKYWLESEGGAHFRHKSGSKRRGRGKGIFLACNRSGNTGQEKAHLPGPERTGPFRLGFTCTAYIHATEHDDGHVTAEFCGDHYGHDARMRLPNVIKYIIAQKQIEMCSPMEIIGYLRHHFLNLASTNIYAQRICYVDAEELKSIHVSCTKKWKLDGIPRAMELWEEELLEKVGIEWPESDLPHSFNEPRKLTTTDIARQEGWPRPRVFVAKCRREDGVLVAYDLPPGGVQQSAIQDDYEPEMFMEMGDERYPIDEAYIPEDQLVVGEEEEVQNVVVSQSYRDHPEMLKLEDGDVSVEVENEVIVTTVDSNDQIISEEKEHVVMQSPSQEQIVIVDGDEDEEIDIHHHQLQHQHHRHQHQHLRQDHDDLNESRSSNVVERYIEANKANTLEEILEEIEAFKHTVLKRAEQTSPNNLKSLLVRFQALHQSAMEKEHNPASGSVTVFPNRAKYLYRPGKGLEKSEDYLNRGSGEISLQPIEDEISDDEELMVAAATVMPFNASIWN
ncbi:hypothetical protein CAEBREN_15331 [Caenorhabditis brenneri]|uniref:C2H2-type domain-containing protein n=1 Tax=Caenorhabditis brenneri TaxID=135651 RepID=G0PGH3_CAEBE|nr:hypothetical protein CAEBREN_15331 [Caenorhabditis brenneri]